MKIGLLGSQELLDEMTVDRTQVGMSTKANDEYKKIMGYDNEDETG